MSTRSFTIPPPFVTCFNFSGEERIALGSDYPFPLGEHVPGKMIETMDDLDDATKQRLLTGTALEFLGLDRLPG